MLVITRGYSEIVEVIGWFFSIWVDLGASGRRCWTSQQPEDKLSWSSMVFPKKYFTQNLKSHVGSLVVWHCELWKHHWNDPGNPWSRQKQHIVSLRQKPTTFGPHIYIVCIAFFLVAADIVGSFLGMYIYQQLNICVCYIHVDHVCIYRLFCDNRWPCHAWCWPCLCVFCFIVIASYLQCIELSTYNYIYIYMYLVLWITYYVHVCIYIHYIYIKNNIYTVYIYIYPDLG